MAKSKAKRIAVFTAATALLLGPLTSTVMSGPSEKQQSNKLHPPFSLKAPVSVADVGMFRDGGTTFVILADSSGSKEELCFDYQIGSKTRGRLYIGAVHRTKPGARLVPLGSALEKQVTAILQRHLDRQFSRSEQKAIAALQGGEVFNRYGEKGVQARRLLKGILGLKSLPKKQAGLTALWSCSRDWRSQWG